MTLAVLAITLAVILAVAVEPEGRNFEVLMDNVEQWIYSKPGVVECVHAGIGEKKRIGYLYRPQYKPRACSLWQGNISDNDLVRTQPVMLYPFEKFWDKEVKFVKCDIEGAEVWVLDWLKTLRIPEVRVEVHDYIEGLGDELRRQMKELREFYEVERL